MHEENYPYRVERLKEQLASDPGQIENVHDLADSYADLGHWDAAVGTYQKAIALDPTDADLYNSLGTVYEEVGNLEEAERVYQQAIVLRPDDSMAYYNLGSLYAEQQRIPEAFHTFERCLKYSTDSVERSTVRAKLAQILPELKDITLFYKRIRGWAIGSMLVGGVSIVAGRTLDPVWGITLLVVGIVSLWIKIPAMFVVYSVVLAWAALMNVLAAISGSGVWWLTLALLQVIWVFATLKEFRKCRRLPLQVSYEAGIWPSSLPPPQNEVRITDRFAIVSVILSLIAIVLLPCLFLVNVAVAVITDIFQPSQWLIWLALGTINAAVLALGLGSAAVLSENTRRGWAIAGVIVNGLVLFGWLGVVLLENLVQ